MFDDPMGEIVVVRHGETEWSRSGQHTSVTDLPLLPDGEDQARALGASLSGRRFVDVWVSPRDTQSTQERYLDATLALQRVSVSPVTQDSGRFGAASSTMAVQLRVPRDKVAQVIAAVDKQSRFTLVPVPGQASS